MSKIYAPFSIVVQLQYVIDVNSAGEFSYRYLFE